MHIWPRYLKGQLNDWTGGDYHHEYDESWPEFKSRIEVALQDLCDELAQSKPRYAVVFTSGGVISVVAGKLLGLSPNKTFALKLGYCQQQHDHITTGGQ